MPEDGPSVGPDGRSGPGRWARARSYLPVSWRSTAGVAAAATVLNWPAWTTVRPGLDASWQAGIAEGFTHHLQWGPGLDFTYGPYGFAGFLEPFYRLTSFIAVLYILAITWLLASLIVGGARRYWGLASAGVVAWAVIAVFWEVRRAADFASAVGLGLGLFLLEERRGAVRTTVAVGLGALAGFAGLVKLSDGVVVGALLVLAAWGGDVGPRERLRTLGLGLGALVVVFLAAWGAASQSYTNLPSFMRASISLVLGYSANMTGSLAHGATVRWAVAIVIVIGVVFAVALRHHRRRAQVMGALMVSGFCWAVAKDGFVSGNHFPGFFRLILAATVLACLLRVPKVIYACGLAGAAAITLSVTVLPKVDPLGGVHELASQVVDLAQPGRFARLVSTSRRAVIRDEGLSRAALAAVRGHTVAIEPWADIIAWADPDVRWRPEPVVQSYSAFTSYTDELDAKSLTAKSAPQRLLYWHYNYSFDFRDPYMDPPATTEAVYCNYRQLAVDGRWQVLAHVPDRCSSARKVGEAHAHFGEEVKVPEVPGKMVLATFAFGPRLLDKLETLVLKAPSTYLKTWSVPGPLSEASKASAGTTSSERKYRFVTGTAADAHVLSVPRSLGYAPRFTPRTVHRVELLGDGYGPGQGKLTVTFWAVKVRAT